MKITKTQMITIGSVAAISITAAVICFIVFIIKNYSMKISKKGVELIKSFESLRLTAYQDDGGVWTIGWGHTKGVKQGDTCTLAEAEDFLQEDIADAEKAINKHNLKLNQNQYDALVSFVFNIGESKFNRSTLLKKLKNDPNDPDIKEEFAKWKFIKKNESKGLVNRREKESNLYFA